MSTPALPPGPGDGWYEDISEPPEQADILFEVPLIGIEYAEGDVQFVNRSGNIVVLTQSCDFQKKVQKTILVAELHDFEVMRAVPSLGHLNKTEFRRNLEEGTAVAECLLPPAPGGQVGWSLVNFRDVYIVPKELIEIWTASGKGLRLASPYREHLAQAFARFVMRVGLPNTLDGFVAATTPAKASAPATSP